MLEDFLSHHLSVPHHRPL